VNATDDTDLAEAFSPARRLIPPMSAPAHFLTGSACVAAAASTAVDAAASNRRHSGRHTQSKRRSSLAVGPPQQ
jgi:hypothetical protein